MVYGVTAANSHLVKAERAGYGHGAYPDSISMESHNGAKALNGVLETHQYVILWCEAPPDHVYPIMARAKADMADESKFFNEPKGGIRMDMDYRIGTYALYQRSNVANNWTRKFWADFDHWPVESGTLNLIPGLANGHYHPGIKTAYKQNQATDEMREILLFLHFNAH
jgi:hypothetical protein